MSSVIGDHLLAGVPETDVCLDGGHALAERLVLCAQLFVFVFQRLDAVVFPLDFPFECVDPVVLAVEIGRASCRERVLRLV